MTMILRDSTVYVGPNPWAYFPTIRLTVDLGPLEAWPTGRLGPDFQEGLLTALPGLREHRCSYGVPGGFVRRLTEDEGTWLGHVLEHTAIALQNLGGFPVSFGRARGVRGQPGLYDVVYEYGEREVGLAAGRLAFALLHSLLPPELRPAGADAELDWDAALASFLELARARTLGPSTAALVAAAAKRRIPWERLDGDHLIQLGYGVHQRRLHASITGTTSHIAVDVAQDKALTARLLDAMGIPVPAQERVRSEDEAVAAARRLGFPVVVKPLDGNQGRGVRPGIRRAEDVRAAFRDAWEEGGGVLVEEHVYGFDHRLLVIGDEVVATARRVPAHVVGDGTSTVAELVARVNADPDRGEGHEKILTRITLDEEALSMLERRGLGPDGMPPANETIWLRATANLSRGGTAVDVTDEVHPDNRMLAVRAARAVGLDVAGVDFLTRDISRSYLEDGEGAVCEVNAAPGLRMHLAPSEGNARDVAGAVLDHLFPDGGAGRIPIAAITGTNGKTTTARMVAHVVSLAGLHVGLTTTSGVYVGGRLVAKGDASGPGSARMVLRDPTVECAVLETARGGILREGLAFRHCSVGAVLNVTEDHLGLGGVETIEDLAEVKRLVADVATDVAVLNGDDPLCLAMAENAAAIRVCLVSMERGAPRIEDHVRTGGLAIVLEDVAGVETIVLRDGPGRLPLVPVQDVPATMAGLVHFNVTNAMFAAAIALGLGVDAADVRAGLSTFQAGIAENPGRLSVYDAHPFRAVVDYGHNPAAVGAVCEVASRLAEGGRRICVVAAPGDRRDDDIRAVARAAAGHCDLYICRRDDSLRGRGSDEVPLLLREGLLQAGVPEDRILVVPAEEEAILTGLQAARPGDLVLLFADDVPRTWQQVASFRSAAIRAVQDRRGGEAAEGVAWSAGPHSEPRTGAAALVRSP